jgi:riboflavin synthase alpha subunit
MFTGIIEALGKVVKYDGNRLSVWVPFRSWHLGESIAVDGVCLTATRRRGKVLTFDIGPETRRVTTLGALRVGSGVNLERALRMGDRLGGHLVSGHVEQTGRIEKLERDGPNRWIFISFPRFLRRYLIPKGSLTVDGISLTVVSIRRNVVKIMLVPHTLSHTTLGRKKPGDRVNLEPDLLAKYVEALRLYS